jgi:hypothetical protein
MYLIITASKDTYVTNKIINSAFSASDANTGRAATIDLFKLYSESVLSGTTNPIELSRGLLKFDFTRIKNLTASILDLNASSFECRLEMFDIVGGQVAPTNFNLILFPLSQSFDEGIGRDVISFSDLDACNFVTASFSNGSNNIWNTAGANAQGTLGDESIDIMVSGNLSDGDGNKGLGVSQTFVNGDEDLSMNITTLVSATMAGVLPDHGFRLSFTGSEEDDTKTRFVKRFASRHVRNPLLRPRMVVSFDDTRQDDHENFFFNLTGSIFLENYHLGARANILSGTYGEAVSGEDCMIVKLQTGSFSAYLTASQYQAGTKSAATGKNYLSGIYVATGTVDSHASGTVIGSSTVRSFAEKSGSLTFDEYWTSADGTVGFFTGSLKVRTPGRTSFNATQRDLQLTVVNAKSAYRLDEKVKIRIFARDLNADALASKLPIRLKSIVVNEIYYRIKDAQSGKIIIPFKKNNNGTRLSCDNDGMYFEMFMEDLPVGRTYTFEFLIIDRGIELIKEAKDVAFRVDP